MLQMTGQGIILPESWTTFTPHEIQARAFHSTARFVNLACGRGSGKTELARRKIVASLCIRKPWKTPLYFYTLPTFQQARRVAWRPILDLIPEEWIVDATLQDMRIRTIFGSELYVSGADKPERLEGVQWDGGVMDEACDTQPKAFDLSLLPALAHRKGWCWRIGVPKRAGIGSRSFKMSFDIGLRPNKAETESYLWKSSTILTPEEIVLAREKLDEKDFREQYEASWEQAGGLIWHAFSLEDNLRDDLCQYDPTLPLLIGQDFNVDPMSWVIGQYHIGLNRLLILDEIYIKNCNTPEALQELYNKWGPKHEESHNKRWIFVGDAASKQRHTSANLSDYLHIVNCKLYKDKEVKIRDSNPAIADRFSVGNSVLKNAEGDTKCYIHSRCKALIADLDYRAYKEGTSIPNDTHDVGHMSDAWSYLTYYLYPMIVEAVEPAGISEISFG